MRGVARGVDISLEDLATKPDFGDEAAFAKTKVSRDTKDRKKKRVDVVEEMNSSFWYCRLADNLGSQYKLGFVSLACLQRGLGGISSM
jgi:hypothetical protein